MRSRPIYRKGNPDDAGEEYLRIEPDGSMQTIKVHDIDNIGGQKYTFFELKAPHPMNTDFWVKRWPSIQKAEWLKAVKELNQSLKKVIK